MAWIYRFLRLLSVLVCFWGIPYVLMLVVLPKLLASIFHIDMCYGMYIGAAILSIDIFVMGLLVSADNNG